MKLNPFYKKGSLSTSMPIYVTRPHGKHGVTGSVEASIWMPLLVFVLVFLNAVGWGIYGLVELVEKVVG